MGQRLQLGRYTGAWNCVSSVWRREGLYPFFRSMPATLAMNVPYTGMLVATNESLKLALELKNHDAEAPLSKASWYFACAGISGALAAFITSPLDVLKTRLQIMDASPTITIGEGLPPKPAGMLSMVSLFSALVRTEGLRVCLRGAGMRVLLAAPGAAISWGTYETICMGFQQYMEAGWNPKSSWADITILPKIQIL